MSLFSLEGLLRSWPVDKCRFPMSCSFAVGFNGATPETASYTS